MAYNQDSGLDFRPYRPGDFTYKTPIVLGGQTSTPYRRGVEDLAVNQLTLWAQAGHPLVLDAPRPTDSTVTLTSGATDYDFAAYYFPIPSFLNSGASSGRRYLTVEVRGYVSAGTWTPKARAGGGGTATGSSGNTVSSIISMDVPIAQGPGEDYLILTVQGNTGGATFTFESVTAYIKTVSSTTLTAGTTTYSSGYFHPVDSTVQTAADRPFTVDMARSIIQANDEMFKSNVRQVVNYCNIANYGTLWGAKGDTEAATGRPLILDGELGGYKRFWEWLYFPRQGVTGLKIWVDGYVRGWASSGDNVGVTVSLRRLDDGTGVGTPAYFSIAKGDFFSSATWASGNNLYITDIEGEGPFIVDIRTRPFAGTSTDVRLTAVSIYEEIS